MPIIIKNGKTYGDRSVSLTQAEYNALSETEKTNGTVYYIYDVNATPQASDVAYDNTESGLDASNVQGALDELGDGFKQLQNVEDFGGSVGGLAQTFHKIRFGSSSLCLIFGSGTVELSINGNSYTAAPIVYANANLSSVLGGSINFGVAGRVQTWVGHTTFYASQADTYVMSSSSAATGLNYAFIIIGLEATS